MAKRRTLIRLALLSCLCLTLSGVAQSQQLKGGALIRLDRDSITVGRFHATLVSVDTTGTPLRVFISNVHDSLAGTDQRDVEQTLYLARNFAEGTPDTGFFQMGNGTAIYTQPLTLNSSLDRFIIQTRWNTGESSYGPVTVGSALPSINPDSVLVYALTRQPTQTNGAYEFLVFKRPRSNGFDATAVTTGGNTFVASESIDNVHFPDSVGNDAVFIHGKMRIKFP